eukprot:12931654-Prorocentrum_lima.AAC.1
MHGDQGACIATSPVIVLAPCNDCCLLSHQNGCLRQSRHLSTKHLTAFGGMLWEVSNSESNQGLSLPRMSVLELGV